MEAIRQEHRHRYGTEIIHHNAINSGIPAFVTPDIKLIAFRAYDLVAMVGYKSDRIFHVLWIDRARKLYDHGYPIKQPSQSKHPPRILTKKLGLYLCRKPQLPHLLHALIVGKLRKVRAEQHFVLPIAAMRAVMPYLLRLGARFNATPHSCGNNGRRAQKD